MTRLLLRPVVLCTALAASACSSAETPEPPVAAATVRVNHERAAAGSPLDITYKFVVAEGAKINGTYRVFLHVVDTDEERMWTDDHDPPTPTSEWRPGETIEYTRTVFIPIFPYVGDATMQLGLYSDRRQQPAAARRRGYRPTGVQGGATAPAAADREPLHPVQGRVAPGRSGPGQLHRRVAMDEA